MILRKFLNRQAVTSMADLRFIDETSGEVVLSLDHHLPEQTPLKLTLPCGSTQLAQPRWSRSEFGGGGRALAGFSVQDFDRKPWGNLSQSTSRAPRDYPRVPFRTWVSFPDENRGGTTSKDISLQGCRIATSFEGRVGDTVRIFLELGQINALLDLKARVAWSSDTQAGLHFQNLRVKDELLLLQALGQSTVPPSTFLPHLGLRVPAYTYRIAEDNAVIALQLSVSNWDVTFEIQNGFFEGASRGAFDYVIVLDRSEQLDKLRASQKIPLSEPKPLVHIILLDDNRRKLCEVVGREKGFQRTARRPACGDDGG